MARVDDQVVLHGGRVFPPGGEKIPSVVGVDGSTVRAVNGPLYDDRQDDIFSVKSLDDDIPIAKGDVL